MTSRIAQWITEPGILEVGLGIVAAFILGLVIGRLWRARKGHGSGEIRSEEDKAFYKGVQYILSNEHDQAIEAFTQSVQINSETIETYVALGNLYRSRGDIDRAIRIRQSIIARPHIDEEIKLRALIDLGLDYRKGGFLSWALDTFQKVLQKRPSDLNVLKEVEKIYEELRDWENAFLTRQKIAKLSKGNHGHILAHHQTEMGKAWFEKGDFGRARACFKKALSLDPGCVDAYLHLGDLHFSRKDYNKAIDTWKRAVKVAPKFTFLAYRRLEGAYSKMKNLQPVEDFLRECAESHPDAFTYMALARYRHNEQDYEGAVRELKAALEIDPSFWEARKFLGEILLSREQKEEALAAYQDLISHLNVPYLKFQCLQCGFSPPELQWQCPQCRRWDTVDLVESRTVNTTSTLDLQEKHPFPSDPRSEEDR
ncbi:MAG: tetratricopeptide repeat protein [Deltaproteobacteria bacterium]|nr:tetratricopeptide repeat protein [Deltaproteobacteria bacterium]MBW2016809.1 tetratricopeptide repeat protein [Deltaproteobacteria bacterium]MBW2128439.1 tetratricopeptide repeat protein [Deltaproteobacteria bacterium]MBW2303507.1 tetratricopeptide repeat protein [Deltaproteobacteria bacterium]